MIRTGPDLRETWEAHRQGHSRTRSKAVRIGIRWRIAVAGWKREAAPQRYGNDAPRAERAPGREHGLELVEPRRLGVVGGNTRRVFDLPDDGMERAVEVIGRTLTMNGKARFLRQ